MEKGLNTWITGLTIVAVVSTIVASPYAANIFNSLFNGIASTYKAAKH